jgi:hypothetical protein
MPAYRRTYKSEKIFLSIFCGNAVILLLYFILWRNKSARGFEGSGSKKGSGSFGVRPEGSAPGRRRERRFLQLEIYENPY